MAASTQDREPGPQPPHPQPAPDDDREDIAGNEDEESTPFLLPSDYSPAAATPTPSFPRTIRALTGSALTFAALTLASLFATAVARQAGPGSFNLPWPTKDGLNGVVAPAIFSVLFSAYNLRRLRRRKRAAPLPINLIVDILIAFFAITYGAGGLSGLLDGQGGWCSYPGGDNYSLCRRGALALQVVAGIAMGGGIVLGVLHLALFCVRCRVAYGAGLGPSNWRVPAGPLKLEVSVKFLREPEREAGVDA